MIDAIKNYVLGSYAEAKKVNWPSRQQTINYSLLVIGLSIGMALFFALLDYGLNFGITRIITR